MLLAAIVALGGCADGGVLNVGSNTQGLSPSDTAIRQFLGPASAQYATVESYSLTYPHTKATAHFGIYRHVATGELAKFVFDDAGTPTSAPEMQAQDLAKKRALYGPFDPDFLATVQKAPATSHDVVIGYSTPVPPKPAILSDPTITLADVDSALKTRRQQQSALLSPARLQLLSFLASNNATVVDAPVDMPYVRAHVSASSLLAMAKAVPAIESIGPAEQSSPDPAATQFFWASDDLEAKETFLDVGKHANGIKIGLFESVAGCGVWYYKDFYGVGHPDGFKEFTDVVHRSAPAINGCNVLEEGAQCLSACDKQVGVCRGGICAAWHMTASLSYIGSTYPFTGSDHDRLSNQAKIFVGNTGSVTDKYYWFDANGVRLVNNSETKHSTDAQNWYVRNEYITITHPAGNEAASPTPPDCSVNAICVGAGEMVTSINDTDHWKTDPRDDSNKYMVNGYHNHYKNGYQLRSYPDVEKPDLIAMIGPQFDPISADWHGCDGTSCAAPTVAGLAGLLQEHAPFTASWPELVRPLLMASAVSHNVEGAQLSLNSGSDERDGAGVPVASVLKKIIDNQWYVKGPLYPSSFDSNNEYEATTVSVPAGQGVRVVLGYLHCVPSLGPYSDNEYLAVDLDLILEVDGQLVGWSWSSNNSLESWEWNNSYGTTKTVHIIIKKYGTWQSCNGLQREYFGVAWAKHNGSYIVP